MAELHSLRTGAREALMAQGDALWTELCAALDAADPDAPLHDPDAPAWTARDVYTHVWRMHTGSAAAIRFEVERGERYHWPDVDEDELNERRVAEDRAWPLAEARRRAHESRAVYRALMVSLTGDQFEAIGRRHGDDLLGGHYHGHLTYLRGGA
jgi:hypothetical protein